MLRVTIAVEPGDGGDAFEIAELEIWNRTEVGDVCDYGYELRQKGGLGWVIGSVDGHRRADGWEALVSRVMQEIVS